MTERTEPNPPSVAETPASETALTAAAPPEPSPAAQQTGEEARNGKPDLPPENPPPAASPPEKKPALLDRLPPLRGSGGVMLVGLLLIALLGWQWVELRHRVAQTQEQLARRLADGANQLRDAKALATTAQEALKAQGGQIAVLEARLSELNAQQAALEGLYQELSRGRDEWMLSEVDQLIVLAGQQLQLAGNVQGAIKALSNAEARLGRSERPQFIALRKAIAKDLLKLRSTPLVDVAGLALRLENAALAVDQMSFAFEARPAAPVGPTVKIKAKETREVAPLDWTQWWHRWTSEVWQEIHQLIRLERFDRPDPALLAPQNSVFLKENVKLRLLGARLALLGRDQASFKGELRQAVQWLEKYFDTRERSVAGTLEALKPLIASDLSIEPPALSESQNALRSIKLSAERIVR